MLNIPIILTAISHYNVYDANSAVIMPLWGSPDSCDKCKTVPDATNL